MKRNNRRKPDLQLVLMRLVCVLLFLVLGSTSILSGQLARYVTAGSGSDTARVAGFDITQLGTLTTEFTLDISPETSATRQVTVSNSSEVAVNYSMTLSNPEDNLPLEFSAKDSKGNALPLQKVGDAYTFTGFLAPNGSSDTYTVTIGWEAGKNTDFYSGKVDLIQITLTAAQAD